MQTSSSSASLHPTRRRFLQGSAAASIGALTLAADSPAQPCVDALPPAFSQIKPLGSRVRPITAEEFGQRIQHVQQLMAGSMPSLALAAPVPKYDALFLAPGTFALLLHGHTLGLK